MYRRHHDKRFMAIEHELLSRGEEIVCEDTALMHMYKLVTGFVLDIGPS